MPTATLKEATKELGISLEDVVEYRTKGNKGIIEVTLPASDQEIQQAALVDVGEDFLSEEELDYYLNLEEL